METGAIKRRVDLPGEIVSEGLPNKARSRTKYTEKSGKILGVGGSCGANPGEPTETDQVPLVRARGFSD